MRILYHINRIHKPIASLGGWLLLFLTQAFPQHSLYFENYTSEKGLSQNSCYAIAQDASGFMWFGTQDGLNRYDGKEFKVYLPKNGRGQNLPSNLIASLFFDQTTLLLWVGTSRGVCVYDPKKDSILNITSLYPFAYPLDSVSVKKIISFKKGEYWIVTFSNGLICVNTDQEKLTYYFNDSFNEKKVSGIVLHQNRLIVALLQQLYELVPRQGSYLPKPLLNNNIFPEIKELYSSDSLLWLGTLSSGFVTIKQLFTRTPLVKSSEPQAGGINAFVNDRLGNLWMGTRGKGVLVYGLSTNELRYTSNEKNNTRSLGKNFVLALFGDRQGIIWVGLSGGGVAKFDPLRHQFNTINNEPENGYSLPDNMVFCLQSSANGNYYVGTQNNGLAEWNPANGHFLTFPGSSRFGSVNNTIYDMEEDNRGNIWVAGWGGLMQLNSKTKQLRYDNESSDLAAKKLYAVHKLHSADSLMVAGENGLAFFSLKDNMWKPWTGASHSKNFSGRYIFEDSKGIIWICTVGEGLLRYDHRSNDLRAIAGVQAYSLNVRHLYQKGDRFWLATDNGIVIYDYLTNRVEKQFVLSANNQSGVCYAISEDNNGFMWVSSNTGLYRIHPTTLQTVNYDIDNGLNFLEFNTACVLKEKDGSLLFGGVGGITRFNPLLLKQNLFSPTPFVTALYINDTAWTTGASLSTIKDIKLSYKQNFVTIYFAATNFSNQNKTSFSYRLKGLNDEWVRNGNRNFVNYTALQPGSYVFELKSANSDGKSCNGITQLNITITPPWWQTWWLRSIALLLIATIVLFFIKRSLHNIRKEAALTQKIAESEMTALRAQMNPHFIFNSLNSINSFIVENKTHLASDYLTKFSRLMRLILDNSKNESITLEKEMETLKLYLLMESIRFDKKFDYDILIETGIDQEQIRVPPMIIQPYVENSIWHGLLHKKEKGKVMVQIKKLAVGLEISIEDNGIGRARATELKSKNSHTRKSYGMQITNDRIGQLNEKNIVEITDLRNQEGNATGTKVVIRLYE
jgi:ligand-binding sensor domain-containing protein/anti-sigma regulatory factor (Ser/Thr protein kinase)